MITFTIEPYSGAMPITFEMSPEEVERVVGPADRLGTNSLGEREEGRGPVVIRYSKDDGRVVEIGFVPGARVTLRGHDLFEEQDLLGILARWDAAREFVGFLIYLGLGVTVTGFHDGDNAQRAITVFRRGRWDEFSNDLAPFRK
jgi:hypothetical protein